MKDLENLASQCQAELLSIGIRCGEVSKWVINTRAKKRWGLCRQLSDGTYEIQISHRLLSDEVSDIAAKNTIIHELLHTCPGCLNHTGKWLQLATMVNLRLPMYSIKRTTSAEEKGLQSGVDVHAYRYILQCQQCGKRILRHKKSVVIEHPEHYRCVCGGKLTRMR